MYNIIVFILFVFPLALSQRYATRTVPSSVQVWAPGFQGSSAGYPSDNPQTFEQIATNYDLTVYTAPSANRATMKSINPNFKMLRYINGGFSTPGDVYSYTQSAYAVTSNGSAIYAAKFPQNRLMNPLDESRKSGLIYQCNNYINQAFDGCFFDTVGLAPTGPNYVTPNNSIDPRTGQPWTKLAWLIAQNASMANVVAHKQNPSSLIFGNCIDDGIAYYKDPAPTSLYLGSLEGVFVEQFLRGPSDSYTSYPSFYEFNATINMLVDSGNKGRYMITTTKMWRDPTEPFYTAEKTLWHKYALATFLLGSHSKAYFSFQYANDEYAPFQYQEWWNTNIGNATSAFFIKDGVYCRNFTRGAVVVNPQSYSQTLSLPTGVQFINLNGDTVKGSYAIPKTSGDILARK